MTTFTYERVHARRQHVGTCPNCGKRVTRTKTFEHTVNPFNRNPDGTIKTYEQVRAAVNAEADAWAPDFTHCNKEASDGE